MKKCKICLQEYKVEEGHKCPEDWIVLIYKDIKLKVMRKDIDKIIKELKITKIYGDY